MYIQVKSMDGKQSVTLTLSRLATVPDIKQKVKNAFGMDVSRQKLYYQGKHLEDQYKLFDYNVKLNDVIQVMEAQVETDTESSEKPKVMPETKVSETKNEAPADVNQTTSSNSKEAVSQYFRVGDLVDCRDIVYGAWFEAKIVKIINPDNNKTDNEDNFQFSVLFQNPEHETPAVVLFSSVRPRAKTHLTFKQLIVGNTVMVNYNLENPTVTGYWYDVKITSLQKRLRGRDSFLGTLFVGNDKIPIEGIEIIYKSEEVMEIEKPRLLTPTLLDKPSTSEQAIPLRDSTPPCSNCRNKSRKCKECGCNICGGKENPDKQIMCDECDMAFHITCLDPPLASIPEVDDWYCPGCKNDENEIVKAGENLKESKKKAKLPSSSCKRDWGQGFATVGRTKQCTIVPPNHFGEIPGVYVGTSWLFRMQVSEDGVHRTPVAGIHGRESDGAYSIALSGGYEDDIDNGDEFMYTGSGGRDLSGNKRTAEQTSDQELTALNRALAVNCNAEVNVKEGAVAKDWKKGKPVRVVRNFKLKKHSKYAPDVGNRYDGIYKVVKYYPEKGKSGFKVWRYLLRRDDPAPAPWTKQGKKIIEDLGLQMIYPEGYLEAQAAKQAEKEEMDTPNKKKNKKALGESPVNSPNAKKQKLTAYKLESEVKKLINGDINYKLWDTCKEALKEGKPKFIAKVAEAFMCICCQELVHQPITTSCKHNICKVCLTNSFAAEVYTCPNCRNELGEDYCMKVNETLSTILLTLYPGYQVGR